MTSELDTICWVRELLESQSTMTLATVDEHGSPDAAPLFFFLRDDLTLYWLSPADSRHSINLRAAAGCSCSVLWHLRCIPFWAPPDPPLGF